jgi:hypothetical protein
MDQTFNLSSMSVVELKALAYDMLGNRERLDINIKQLHTEIEIREKATAAAAVAATPKRGKAKPVT